MKKYRIIIIELLEEYEKRLEEWNRSEEKVKYEKFQKLKELGKNPSKTSQHLIGQAADIDVPQKYLFDVFKIIRDKLPYDQLLYEHDLQGHKWIHVSYNHGKNRKHCIDNYEA